MAAYEGLNSSRSILFQDEKDRVPTDSNVCFPDVSGSRCLLQTRYLGGEKPKRWRERIVKAA